MKKKILRLAEIIIIRSPTFRTRSAHARARFIQLEYDDLI